ncbi:hypothetical protein ANO11243_015340 [Dothideomycetidae sp. 11243]|nr:hypothetical protein ANO11243_015340 [fungal sp. No.11243]
MSAILSADDLNDFISPSVACIKPVETLPTTKPAQDPENSYEVTTEDAAAAANAPPAQITLTDCLACSGCVTSAEAILVSLQSHQEVLTTLDAYRELPLPPAGCRTESDSISQELKDGDGKIFVASVSPQARANIAATFDISEGAAGNLIQQFLSGEDGLRSGGKHGSGFAWVLDTNAFREIALAATVEEMGSATNEIDPTGDFTRRDQRSKKPILTSACPGWICYAEKTHPHVLPHISKLKSPQALAGTLVKTILSRKYGIPANKIWHMAVMPCFDKKLEASREELTDPYWQDNEGDSKTGNITSTGIKGCRDVDVVITSRELLSLAEARNISLPHLPRRRLHSAQHAAFPDARFERFLFPRAPRQNASAESGSSGGYLWHLVQTMHSRHPGSHVSVQRGRNSDVVEYAVVPAENGPALFRAARFYGFRNIQNLVRRLRPAKASRLPGVSRRPGQTTAAATVDTYDYVEVMACPGGCTNGGGQVRPEDVAAIRALGASTGSLATETNKMTQREWLAQVDEAYFSASSDDELDREETSSDLQAEDWHDHAYVKSLITHWASITGYSEEALLRTTYRRVESDVGKKTSEVERVAGLASSLGGGW